MQSSTGIECPIITSPEVPSIGECAAVSAYRVRYGDDIS
jgi:hypothetical protein